MEKKVAFVNYASDNGWYIDGQNRLKKAWETFGNGYDLLCFQNEEQIGSPTHHDNPYAFKLYAMRKAREQGYNIVIYMDASMYPVKNVSLLVDYINENKYLMETAGHWTGTWANDRALQYFGINRDQAMEMPMFSAGLLGLDFTEEICREFFARWQNACDAGVFKGQWTNTNNCESGDPRCKGHRHDMTAASIIANQLNLTYSPGGYFLSYIGKVFGTPSETSVLHLKPA